MTRRGYISYDSDLDTNPRVAAAEKRLAVALRTLNIEPYAVRIPPGPKGKKQGADDYLKGRGKEAFTKLIRTAKPITHSAARGGEPVMQTFAEIDEQDVAWLWTNRIAFGMLNAIIGNPGEGKSTLAMEIAACASRGEEPCSKSKFEPITTLYMSNENVHAITSKPRLLAMGGDPTRIIALDSVGNPDGSTRAITLDDIDVIEKAIVQTDAKLLFIDPLQSYLGAKVDSNQANQTRAKLDPLVKLAERRGVAVVFIAHSAKASAERAIHSMLGSIDIAAAMRSIMMVGTPADDPESRVVLLVKYSVGPWVDTLGFRIEKVDGKGARTRVKWTGVSHLTFADLREPARRSTHVKPQKQRAHDWLRAALAQGPRLATELTAEWAAYSGLEPGPKGRAERTLQQAAKSVSIGRRYEGGKHGKRMWTLKAPKFAAGYRKPDPGPP